MTYSHPCNAFSSAFSKHSAPPTSVAGLPHSGSRWLHPWLGATPAFSEAQVVNSLRACLPKLWQPSLEAWAKLGFARLVWARASRLACVQKVRPE